MSIDDLKRQLTSAVDELASASEIINPSELDNANSIGVAIRLASQFIENTQEIINKVESNIPEEDRCAQYYVLPERNKRSKPLLRIVN